nr:YebC/PmpR family DNA-binding transcriptional regulator [uncultured Carboxylicivirga sp.]
MGRAFEYRKATKLKRWGTMAKTFTKIGKQITICVKEAGPDPQSNSRLRVLIQNAKAANMPKDNVERAIKKATSKDTEDYKEIVYEGYGPFGTAFMVETATDNSTRTVANVRSYFNKYGGSLGTTGCVDYMFEHKCHFKVKMKDGIDLEELELEMIDFGIDEIFEDEGYMMVYGGFESFGPIQKYLEEAGFEIENAEFERIPQDTKELTEEQQTEIDKLLAKFEEDDDVTNVFNNIK